MTIHWGDGTTTDSHPSGGKIQQVVAATKTDTATTTNSSFHDISGMSVNITPSSSSNKILIMVSIRTTSNNHSSCRLLRDSTAIAIGDSSGSRTRASTGEAYDLGNSYRSQDTSIHWLDSPSTTSQITYKMQWKSTSGVTVYINRIRNDSDNAAYSRAASSIVVMEVA